MSAARPRDRTSRASPDPRPERAGSAPTNRGSGKSIRGLRWGRLAVLVAGVLGMLTLLVTGGLWYFAQSRLNQIPKVQIDEGTLAATEPDRPRNFLIIGSDSREGTVLRDPALFGERRSDTMLLVHIDPASKETAILSLPRDTRVEIPGHGTGKLNSAYAIGGRN